MAIDVGPAAVTLPSRADLAATRNGLAYGAGSSLVRAPRSWGKRWRAAMAGYRNGLSNASVMIVGDSTAFGYSTYNSATAAGAWPRQWAKLLRARGEVVADDAWFASGGVARRDDLDTRFVYSGTLPVVTIGGGSGRTCGGYMMRYTVAGGFAYTPVRNVKRFVVYYIKRPTAGTFNINIDGGANTLVTATNGSFAVGSQTIDAASTGAHTLNMAWASGDYFILGVDAFDTDVQQIKIWNAGWYGASSTDWADGTPTLPDQWNPTKLIKNSYVPSLIILDNVINDWRGAISDATTLANLRAILDQLVVNSDVALMTPNPETSGGTYSVASQLAKVKLVRQVAQEYDLPLIEAYDQWVDADGSGTVMNGLGMYADTVHLTAKGYGDKAARVDQAIMALAA